MNTLPKAMVKAESGTPAGVSLCLRLMRHVVAIYFDFTLNQQRHQFVHTAFLLSVDGHWLMMTAGHCVTRISELRAAGGVLTKCLLLDCMGEGATHKDPQPFPYDDTFPMHIGVTKEIDYGVLIPGQNTCNLLIANNIEPFDEAAWDEEPAEVESYFLLGFPEELNALQGDVVNVRASMFRLTRYAERPEDWPEREGSIYFYGRVVEHPLNSLRGCSGGPIIALSPNKQGKARYHLVAMQVATMGRDIEGMLMQPLGQLIRDLIARKGFKPHG